ncbi:hypothetical protein J6590_003139 [Homalodisca vitripennis]|nr:hypothetical protein J6590_003139 [Homalodisca vitripennis]
MAIAVLSVSDLPRGAEYYCDNSDKEADLRIPASGVTLPGEAAATLWQRSLLFSAGITVLASAQTMIGCLGLGYDPAQTVVNFRLRYFALIINSS